MAEDKKGEEQEIRTPAEGSKWLSTRNTLQNLNAYIRRLGGKGKVSKDDLNEMLKEAAGGEQVIITEDEGVARKGPVKWLQGLFPGRKAKEQIAALKKAVENKPEDEGPSVEEIAAAKKKAQQEAEERKKERGINAALDVTFQPSTFPFFDTNNPWEELNTKPENHKHKEVNGVATLDTGRLIYERGASHPYLVHARDKHNSEVLFWDHPKDEKGKNKQGDVPIDLESLIPIKPLAYKGKSVTIDVPVKVDGNGKKIEIEPTHASDLVKILVLASGGDLKKITELSRVLEGKDQKLLKGYTEEKIETLQAWEGRINEQHKSKIEKHGLELARQKAIKDDFTRPLSVIKKKVKAGAFPTRDEMIALEKAFDWALQQRMSEEKPLVSEKEISEVRGILKEQAKHNVAYITYLKEKKGDGKNITLANFERLKKEVLGDKETGREPNRDKLMPLVISYLENPRVQYAGITPEMINKTKREILACSEYSHLKDIFSAKPDNPEQSGSLSL